MTAERVPLVVAPEPAAAPALDGLLARAVRGDEEAFGAFFDATSELVWRLELRRCRTVTEAEESSRRRFRTAWLRAAEQPGSGLSPRAWLLSLNA